MLDSWKHNRMRVELGLTMMQWNSNAMLWEVQQHTALLHSASHTLFEHKWESFNAWQPAESHVLWATWMEWHRVITIMHLDTSDGGLHVSSSSDNGKLSRLHFPEETLAAAMAVSCCFSPSICGESANRLGSFYCPGFPFGLWGAAKVSQALGG